MPLIPLARESLRDPPARLRSLAEHYQLAVGAFTSCTLLQSGSAVLQSPSLPPAFSPPLMPPDVACAMSPFRHHTFRRPARLAARPRLLPIPPRATREAIHLLPPLPTIQYSPVIQLHRSCHFVLHPVRFHRGRQPPTFRRHVSVPASLSVPARRSLQRVQEACQV